MERGPDTGGARDETDVHAAAKGGGRECVRAGAARAPRLHLRQPRATPGVRVLVTGAAGFLGSHLCDRLLAQGHRVIGMDNFITGKSTNVAHLKSHTSFQFVQHDVTTFIELQGPLEGVLHFASPASPVDYLEFPIQTLKVGSLGTHKALGLSKAKGARFLLASTSELYGDPLVHPQP